MLPNNQSKLTCNLTRFTLRLMGVMLTVRSEFELVLNSFVEILRQLREIIRNPTKIGSGLTIDELLERTLNRLLPHNAHHLCSNKVGISMTKVGWPCENKFVTKFNSRRELIDAIRAGCFIPLWSGSLVGPKLKGQRFIDGAYSDNTPSFSSSPSPSPSPSSSLRSVQVSPFASQVEVSPKGESCLFKWRVLGTIYLANLKNIVRTGHAMFPFHLASYRQYFVAGHNDMKDFVLRNNLIKCRQCHELRLEFQQTKLECKQATNPRAKACISCLKLLERVDSLRAPDKLVNMLNE